ncbi:hypothetical protein F5Y11DRAFT_318831 [Daldinia sp. FL1419]|nr:hypothetical protein F5Y11DRAFT_318831 [Daldinia sp. FL1419]
MAVQLNELDRVDDGYAIPHKKPSLESDRESTIAGDEEQEPFIGPTKQNSSTLESQPVPQLETAVDTAPESSGLAKFGLGIFTFVVGMIIATIGLTASLTVALYVARFIIAFWRMIGLLPN